MAIGEQRIRGLRPTSERMDMDMQWGGPEQIEWATARDKGMHDDPLFASRIMKLVAEHEQDVSNYEKQNL